MVSRLVAAGKLYLPDLAYTYARLNNEVANTHSQDDITFLPCPSTGTDVVRSKWTELRDLLQDYLGRGALNYESAGEALVHIADTYEAADANVRITIQDLWKNGVPKRYWPATGQHESLPPRLPPVVIS
jgi:hypothetical protein